MKMPDTAEVAMKPMISRIWIVPVVAALIGLWMTYKYIDDQGVIITISMPSAQGITAGKTLIKTRSVPIGMVTEVRLAENLERVIVAAEIEKSYLHLLKTNSLIWSVQPRIDQSGISGLSTILSGSYFELQPGSSDTTSYQFELLEVPPLLSQNVPGQRYQLYSNTAEVLSVGSPIMFKGYNVGSIEKADFDWKTETMHYQAFIADPYSNLVTENTLFWVESGVELDLSADGINFKTGGLSKLLSGGIAFGIPDREPKGEIAKDGHHFNLGSSYKESLEERYNDFEYYVVTLDQSVRGLRPGAPVEYRGVRVGTVVEVPAILGKPRFIANRGKLIPVLIKIEFTRIYHVAGAAREYWTDNIEQWIKDGLRMSLQTGSLLTGGLFLEIDFYPDRKIDQLKTMSKYKVIPGTSSRGLSQLTAQVSEFLDKLNKLDIDNTLSNIDSTLTNVTQLAQKTGALVQQTNSLNIPAEINQSLKELQSTLKDFQSDSPLYADIQRSLRSIEELSKGFQQDAPIYNDIRQSLKAIEQLGKDFQNGAPVYTDIRRSLKAIEQLSNELQPFAKSLNEHPNILIFDKSPKDDVQPQRGLSNE